MSDKRLHKRQTRKENAFLEITLDDAEQGVMQKVISCETVDLSEQGLKMYMSESVQQGLISDMLIELADVDKRFKLTAEVKWVSPTADDGWYFAGFEIYDGEDTDFESWCEMIAARNK